MSTDGFSGLLADSKCSTKTTRGSALLNSRKQFCDFSSVTPSMVGYVKPVFEFMFCMQCLADITPGEFKEGYMDVTSSDEWSNTCVE